MPNSTYFGDLMFLSTSPPLFATLLCRPLSTGFIASGCLAKELEGRGKYFICNTSYLSQKMNSNTNIPFIGLEPQFHLKEVTVGST
jgi:hypothetical protein